jgi:hypothetical protein
VFGNSLLRIIFEAKRRKVTNYLGLFVVCWDEIEDGNVGRMIKLKSIRQVG